MRPYFILNPVAGGGRAKECFEAVRRYFDALGEDYAFVETTRAGESIRLAGEAYAKGERFIVSVGGDGTLSEIASVLYDKDDVILGICPFGTGNDFVRSLKLPTEPEAAAKVLLEGRPAPADMLIAGDKPFINILGLGFDVDVVINTERYKGRFRGMLPYFLGVLRTMLHLKGFDVRLNADGRLIEENILLIDVANGTHYGGGMSPTPEADPSDGLMDVCVVKKVGLFTFLRLLPRFIKGTHLNSKHVMYFKAGELLIECERAPLQIDGELGEYAPVRVTVKKHALNIMLAD